MFTYSLPPSAPYKLLQERQGDRKASSLVCKDNRLSNGDPTVTESLALNYLGRQSSINPRQALRKRKHVVNNRVADISVKVL